MKQDIKKNALQEPHEYVPASVEVIEFTAQRVVCISPSGDTEDLRETSFTNW